MRSKSDPMVPLSVVRELISLHREHTETITSLIGDFLKQNAIMYERALNPPASSMPVVDRMWISEDEEDEKYLSLAAELNSLKEMATERGLDLEDLRIE